MTCRQLSFGLWLFLFSLVGGCIPTTTVTFDLGAGHGIARVEKVEAIVERLGFVRNWSETGSGQRVPRIERDGRLLSGFESQSERGFGVVLAWEKGSGLIQVVFAERNTTLSERGKQLSAHLEEKLRSEFGDRVNVTAK